MTLNVEDFPGVASERSAETSGFSLNHTMLRVKSPERSLDFYTRVLGMHLLRKVDFSEMKFSLYFLRFCTTDELIPSDQFERMRWAFEQSGVLELTHNWGTEDNAALQYHDGNSQPQGFGHLCISVPNLVAATKWFDENDVVFVKRPADGKMKDIGFIRDPDGYWIEVIQPSLLGRIGTVSFHAKNEL
jgi:lactoylglutathione lyase